VDGFYLVDVSRLRVSELIGVAYFLYLAAVSIFIRVPPARRFRVRLAASVVVTSTLAVALAPSNPVISAVRDWLPMVVILLAYYATGLFYIAPSAPFEAWLRGWDDRLIGPASFASIPAAARVYLELVYDFCFALIPVGFCVLLWSGGVASADRFWTLVSIAEYVPFGTLPWLQARPPWAIEGVRDADATSVRRFSLSWVSRTTIHANTFPSGHASASLAVALGLIDAAPWVAAGFGLLAVSIAVASIVGRFHYAIDAITGLLLAVGVWVVLTRCW
jgi:membrane-associated phospholipid phosphatase